MQLKSFLNQLLNHLEKSDFSVLGVDDSEEYTKTESKKEVLNLLLNLDEAHLIIKHKSIQCGKHYIFMVFESQEYKKEDILDILCDWSYNQDDKDGFNACLESFSEKYK